MGVKCGVIALGLVLGSLAFPFTPAEAFTPPPAHLGCSYSGPPSNTVTFTSGIAEEQLFVKRVGDEIEFFSEHFYGYPVKGKKRIKTHRVLQSPTCNATPTVHNTDRIVIDTDPEESVRLNLSLEGGPLAPGVTPEADGSSEIETTIQIGYGGPVGFVGGPENDRFQFGTTHGVEGVNLNAQDEGASPDVDATFAFRAPPINVSPDTTNPDGAAYPADGDDTVTTAGGPEFDGPFTAGFATNGGGGNDTLSASRSPFAFFKGGPGNDQITGGAGNNIAFGGGGDDMIIAGPKADEVEPGNGHDIAILDGGRDIVAAHDGDRDWISCGHKVDAVAKDHKDRTPGCERKFFHSVHLKPFR
jgi:hypothetical protein